MQTKNTTCRHEGTLIAPLHEVRDAEKAERIAASMRASGWQGDPIVLARLGDGYLAVTGSHRLAACALAGIAPECHVCEADVDVDSCRDTDEILDALEAQDADAETIRLVRAEQDKERE